MIEWNKLIERGVPSISRGALLKFPAKYPFEAYVVMMLCEGPQNSSERCLVTITGHKAGINCYLVFPSEATTSDCYVSTAWLIENWNKWVWSDGDVADVCICDGLSAQDL
ncbi:Imm45 family immunity protein [Variovorax brevis]|uniref:Imm45 family immunity protein n=1 Tax=Variovorax brevis TaxID=3053503 RepID=UPI00336567D9